MVWAGMLWSWNSPNRPNNKRYLLLQRMQENGKIYHGLWTGRSVVKPRTLIDFFPEVNCKAELQRRKKMKEVPARMQFIVENTVRAEACPNPEIVNST